MSTGEPRTVALVVAGGSGTRAGGEVPKQYATIGGKAVLAHAVDALAIHPAVAEVQVVIGAGHEALATRALGDRALPPLVIGGATRRESVAHGLAAINADRVLIHDAARPFCPPEVIDRLLDTLDRFAGAIPVLPVADTLLRVESGSPEVVVPREHLFRVQTPQAFIFEAVAAAHRAWPADREATDDAQMVSGTGHEVAMVAGDQRLEKLTTAADLTAAEARLAGLMLPRSGLGFDVHAFCPGDHLWLGGVRIPHDHALAGHSDADVVLHAVVDAILGAIGAGDIGQHFPPSDPQWKGAPSSRFVEHALGLLQAQGAVLGHVDVTVICEAPRIGPHRDAIRANMARLLRLPVERSSLKATTTECLGFTGRREGIAAQAIATIFTRA